MRVLTLLGTAVVRSANAQVDDPCWKGPYSAMYCCSGTVGKPECWNEDFTYETCCRAFLNESFPHENLLLTRLGDQRPVFAGDWWGGGGSPAAELHRYCATLSGIGTEPLSLEAVECKKQLEVLAQKEAASPKRSPQYVGTHHRLVLSRYPYASFISTVHDIFYKAKVFPEHYWYLDDFALFEVGFRTLLSCGDIAVDAGANIGGYTQMLALSVCASGRVHSFEPFRLTSQLLNANVALAGLTNVYTYHLALSDKAGHTRAMGSDIRDPGQQTIWNSLVMPREQKVLKDRGITWTEDYADMEDIEEVTLDSLQLPQLDFIKIDVEAMEANVIRGGIETIRRFVPSILVEIKKFQRRKLHTILVRELGYECYSMLSTNPSDFLCVHPLRSYDQRVLETVQLWTTQLAYTYCQGCAMKRTGPEPVQPYTDEEIEAGAMEDKMDRPPISTIISDGSAE